VSKSQNGEVIRGQEGQRTLQSRLRKGRKSSESCDGGRCRFSGPSGSTSRPHTMARRGMVNISAGSHASTMS